MRRPSRREGVLLALAVLAVAAFWAISVTINSTPTPSRFEGWIAVLQQGRGSDSEINLTVSPGVTGGSGDSPRLIYSIAACGSAPFRGVLLLGEDARLTDLHQVGPAPPSSGSNREARRPRLEERQALRMLYAGTGAEYIYRDVQVVRLAIPAIDCIPRIPGDREPSFSGIGTAVSGHAKSAVEASSHGPLGFWSGPRSTQAWPYLGSLPGVDPSSLGEFRFAQALPGAWQRPSSSRFNVEVGALAEKATVDFARPTPSSSTSLSWSEIKPFSAVARVTNEEALGMWKTLLVFATIALGVGASFFAALVLGLLRPSRDNRESIERQAATPPQSTGRLLGALVSLAVIAKLAKWVRR